MQKKNKNKSKTKTKTKIPLLSTTSVAITSASSTPSTYSKITKSAKYLSLKVNMLCIKRNN